MLSLTAHRAVAARGDVCAIVLRRSLLLDLRPSRIDVLGSGMLAFGSDFALPRLARSRL